jgi:peptidyl-Lys metalloendopeptidase
MISARTGRFVIVIGLTLVLAAPAAFAAQARLESSLQLLDASDQGVVVQLSLTNTSDEDVYVISYETALLRLERDLFRIERDGEVIPYMGPMIMRVGPLAESWIRIAPGETVSGKVNLSTVYDLSRAGRYSIEYRASQHVLSGIDESLLPVADLATGKGARLDTPRTTVRSEAISFEFEGADVPLASELLDPERSGLSKDSFSNCTSSQRTTIQTAKTGARANACDSCDYCDYYGCGSSWYTTWFGDCTYESSVCQSFCDACSVLGSSSFTFYCNGTYCESGVIAYVYKNRPYEIWICPDFFVYTYFQVHAVTHEVFHWYIVAGAEDWVYGESNCRTLAAYYDPYYAATNADSYAYAADSCPW